MALELKETSRRSEDTYDYIAYDVTLDGQTIGAAGVMTGSPAYVERIDIDEQYRRHGHGTQAIKQLADMHEGIYLAPDNAAAARLYERLGSEYTGEDADYVDQGHGVYQIG